MEYLILWVLLCSVLIADANKSCFPCKLYGTCFVSSCLNCKAERLTNNAHRVVCKRTTCFKKCSQPCICAVTKNSTCVYHLQQYPCLLHMCERKCTEPWENRTCKKFCWNGKNCHMYCLRFPMTRQCRRTCFWKLKTCKRPCRPRTRSISTPVNSPTSSPAISTALQHNQAVTPSTSAYIVASVLASPSSTPSSSFEEEIEISASFTFVSNASKGVVSFTVVSPLESISITSETIVKQPSSVTRSSEDSTDDVLITNQMVTAEPSKSAFALSTPSLTRPFPKISVSGSHSPSISALPTETVSFSSTKTAKSTTKANDSGIPTPSQSLTPELRSISSSPIPTETPKSSMSLTVSPSSSVSISSSTSASTSTSVAVSTASASSISLITVNTATTSISAKVQATCKTNSTIFVLEEWEVSGADVLNASDTNFMQERPFPVGDYNGITLCRSDLILTGVLHASQPSTSRSAFTTSTTSTAGSRGFSFSFSESTTSNRSFGFVSAIEMKATKDIPDLSVYGLEIIMNGTKSMTGREITLLGNAKGNDFLYVSMAGSSFQTFFQFPSNLSSPFIDLDGDDVVLLYKDGKVVDSYGISGEKKSSLSWGYRNGWAYRRT